MNELSRDATVMLALVWTVILVNTGYCFFRLLTSQRNLSGGRD